MRTEATNHVIVQPLESILFLVVVRRKIAVGILFVRELPWLTMNETPIGKRMLLPSQGVRKGVSACLEYVVTQYGSFRLRVEGFY